MFAVVSFFTDHFSGPDRAISPVCVCVQRVTFEPSDFDLGIWHAGLSWKVRS